MRSLSPVIAGIVPLFAVSPDCKVSTASTCLKSGSRRSSSPTSWPRYASGSERTATSGYFGQQDDLGCVSRGHQVECLGEPGERETVADDRGRVETLIQQGAGAGPSLAHAPPRDAVDASALEDDLAREIDGEGTGRDPEERDAPPGGQRGEALVDGLGGAAHLEHDVHAVSVGALAEPGHDVVVGVDRLGAARAPAGGGALGVDVCAEDAARPRQPGDAHGHESDRTAPEDG